MLHAHVASRLHAAPRCVLQTLLAFALIWRIRGGRASGKLHKNAYMWFFSASLSSLDTVSDTLMFDKIYFSSKEFDENARWAVLVRTLATRERTLALVLSPPRGLCGATSHGDRGNADLVARFEHVSALFCRGSLLRCG